MCSGRLEKGPSRPLPQPGFQPYFCSPWYCVPAPAGQAEVLPMDQLMGAPPLTLA